VTDIFAFCERELPQWNAISVSGYHIREAGSTAVQEVAFTLANGIAYVEAWAYGRPVICGESPACRELIEDGVTGIWADQNPANLGAKILSLLQQPDLRARLGGEGRARQQRDLTPERVVNTHLKGLDSSK
jgi:glycosyltransferase involved in cell wall biosynthesis